MKQMSLNIMIFEHSFCRTMYIQKKNEFYRMHKNMEFVCINYVQFSLNKYISNK